jgi:hypothetical protein
MPVSGVSLRAPSDRSDGEPFQCGCRRLVAARSATARIHCKQYSRLWYLEVGIAPRGHRHSENPLIDSFEIDLDVRWSRLGFGSLGRARGICRKPHLPGSGVLALRFFFFADLLFIAFRRKGEGTLLSSTAMYIELLDVRAAAWISSPRLSPELVLAVKYKYFPSLSNTGFHASLIPSVT